MKLNKEGKVFYETNGKMSEKISDFKNEKNKVMAITDNIIDIVKIFEDLTVLVEILASAQKEQIEEDEKIEEIQKDINVLFCSLKTIEFEEAKQKIEEIKEDIIKLKKELDKKMDV